MLVSPPVRLSVTLFFFGFLNLSGVRIGSWIFLFFSVVSVELVGPVGLVSFVLEKNINILKI